MTHSCKRLVSISDLGLMIFLEFSLRWHFKTVMLALIRTSKGSLENLEIKTEPKESFRNYPTLLNYHLHIHFLDLSPGDGLRWSGGYE